MKKKKILFFLEAFDHGGLEKVTLDLVNHLDPQKYDITVMQRFKGGYYRSQLKPHIHKKCCFPLFANGVARCFGWFSGRLLHRIFIHGKYDVEIGDGDGYPCKIIGGSPNQAAVKLAWIHMDVVVDGMDLKEFRTQEGRDRFYAPFDRIVCVSKEAGEKFRNKFGCAEKVRVLYNPLPDQEIQEKAKETPQIPFPSRGFHFLSVGRLHEAKGYEVLLRVHKRLLEEGLAHTIHILGKGPERERLEEEIRRGGLQESFFLLGHQANPYPYFLQADCFVCSSRNEAFSTAVTEAMLLGTPVVTTDCCGMREILGENEYGLITENSEQGLYDGMKRMLTQPELIAHYRRQAEKRGRDFHMEALVGEWEKLLDEEKNAAD